MDQRPTVSVKPLLDLQGPRVALFSGNYNCTRDGANNALNHLGAYLLAHQCALRVYSPTVSHPAFRPAGDLVSVPSLPIPGRREYRIALGLPQAIRRDLLRFEPTVIHLSAPDLLGYNAQRFGRSQGMPIVASLHTRFETYFEFYGLGLFRRLAERYLRRFYSGCDLVLVPSMALAGELRRWGLGARVRIWSRGVDHHLFSPSRRDPNWRRQKGIGDHETAILFFGRIVREKGLEIFSAIIDALRRQGRTIRPLVVGTGPARAAFKKSLGSAIFTEELSGEALARAVASADIMINPSITEAFGNVNLEAMAAGVPLISADVPAARALIQDGMTGLLVPPRDVGAYVNAVDRLISDDDLRSGLARHAIQSAALHDWDTSLAAVLDAYREVGAIALARPAATHTH